MSEKAKEVNEVLSRMGNEVVSLIATSRNLGENYAKLIELLGASPGNGHKEYKEPMAIRDRVILVHRDKDGKVIATRDSGWQEHECLTKYGFAEVAGLLLTDVEGVTAFDYLAIGTGAVAATKDDQTLGTETHREAGVGTRETTTETDDTSVLTYTFTGYAESEGIQEVGMLNAAVLGTLLMRQTFDILNINFPAGDSLLTKVKIQAKQGA
ncbi:hypothetical protein ES708_35159 [subsurface metagenome]